DEPTVTAMHKAWSSAHDAGQNRGEPARSLRTRAEAAVSAVTGPGQRQDRAILASVIQAVDAVAQRCDEIAGRVAELETAINEVVDVLSADLVRARAELAHRTGHDRATNDRRIAFHDEEGNRQDG
ncbi:MAG TPA: hypothetical protein VGG23_07190, partial [Acidimicrobiales bacterium]